MENKNNVISVSEAAEKFFWYVRSNFRTFGEAAKHYNVSMTTISSSVRGKRPLMPAMAKDLNLVKIKTIVFVEIPATEEEQK